MANEEFTSEAQKAIFDKLCKELHVYTDDEAPKLEPLNSDTPDPSNPPYYLGDNGLEAIEVSNQYISNLVGQAAADEFNLIKYAVRWPRKGQAISDLNKIVWYADDLITLIGEANAKSDFTSIFIASPKEHQIAGGITVREVQINFLEWLAGVEAYLDGRMIENVLMWQYADTPLEAGKMLGKIIQDALNLIDIRTEINETTGD